MGRNLPGASPCGSLVTIRFADRGRLGGNARVIAVFYPEDDRYLIERDLTVYHYEVAGSE
jgi:hypothetical protein